MKLLPISKAPRDGSLFLGVAWTYMPGKTEPTIIGRLVRYSGDPKQPWADDRGKHFDGAFTYCVLLPDADEALKEAGAVPIALGEPKIPEPFDCIGV